MICGACGNSEHNDKFCSECGVLLIKESEPNTTTVNTGQQKVTLYDSGGTEQYGFRVGHGIRTVKMPEKKMNWRIRRKLKKIIEGLSINSALMLPEDYNS
jgi:hypothetical protein